MSRSVQIQTQSLLASSIDAYINQVYRIPMLSEKEEKDLLNRLNDQTDVEAARRLIMSYLRFVVSVARNYSGYGLPLGDLIQEGNIGLMKAVKRFNPKVGVRLVTFAIHWIKSEIHEFIIKNWKIVKIATTKAQRKLFFNLRKASKNINFLNRKEAKSISEQLSSESIKITEKDVFEMQSRLSTYEESFDTSSNAENSGLKPSDYLTDSTCSPEAALENEESSTKLKTILTEALNSLDTRSQDILNARWLSQKEKKPTLFELSKAYDVSIERIRQIEKNAMNKIKQVFLEQREFGDLKPW